MRPVLLLLLLCFSAPLLSQIQTEDEFDFNREFTWGVNKNTNSGIVGGIVLKLAMRNAKENMTTYGLEFFNVKHPKEYRYYGNTTGTYYVWGKQNHLFSIRALYGREKVLFKKAQQQGVQISYLAAMGPSLGIISPYYIQNVNGNYIPYEPGLSQSAVIGSGKFLQGLGDANLLMGFSAKAGLSFEFGSFKNSVAGVESGFALEAFPKEIVIIPTLDNRAIFPSIYFTLFWGHRK